MDDVPVGDTQRWTQNKLFLPHSVMDLYTFGEALRYELFCQLGCHFEFHPGLVRTVKPCHQFLHMDTTSNKCYHLHMPLCKDGMTLRLARLKSRDDFNTHCTWEKQDQPNYEFVHIPFGSFILIHSNQFHAGLYGENGNIRLHAVLPLPGEKLNDGNLQYWPNEDLDRLESNFAKLNDERILNTKVNSDAVCDLLEIAYPYVGIRELVEKRFEYNKPIVTALV